MSLRCFLRNPRKVRKNCLKKFLSRRFLKGYGKDCMIAWKTIFSPIHWKLWLVPKSMLHKCLTVRWSYPTRLLKMQKLASTCHTVTMDLLRVEFGEHLFHLRNRSIDRINQLTQTTLKHLLVKYRPKSCA